MQRLLLLFLLLTGIPAFAQNDQIVQKGNKFIYKGDGRWLWHTRYDSIRNFSENRAAVRRKGKWGYIDEKGNKLISCFLQSAGDFHGGLAAIQRVDERWRIINRDMHIITPVAYDTIVQIDSLTLAYDISWILTGNDTDIQLWKYPDLELYNPLNAYEQKDSLLLIVYEGSYVDTRNGKRRPTAQLITTNGREKSPEFFQDSSIFRKPVIVTDVVTYNMAVISPEGNVSTWYSNINTIDSTHYAVSKGMKVGVMNSRFQITVPIRYSQILDAGSNYILRDESNYFLADSTGRKLSEDFQYISYLGNGMCAGRKNYQGLATFLIDANGAVSKDQYGYVYPLCDSMYRVVSADYKKYAFLNYAGEQITPWYDRSVVYIPQETSGGGFLDALGDLFFGTVRLIVGVGTLGMSEILGWFDTPGYVAPAEVADAHKKFPGYDTEYNYFYGSDFHNGYAFSSVKRQTNSRAQPKEEWVYIGIVDSTGRQLLNNEYLSIYQSDSVYIVEKTTGFGIVSLSGKIILKPIYGTITAIGHNYFEVLQNMNSNMNALYYIESGTGKFLTSFRFYNIESGGDSLFIVQPDAFVSGYMNRDGKVIIPMKYDEAGHFEDGKAEVKLHWYDDESYYIDKKGNRIPGVVPKH